MSMVGFPLLLIPLAIVNIVVFLMPGVSFAAPVFTLTLMSGVAWTVTFGDILLALAILLLMFEVIKGGRPGGKYLTDHLLSLLLLCGAAAEFILLPQFGNSIYFLLTALAFVDFVSGIALRARRGRRVIAAAPTADMPAAKVEQPAPVPEPEAPPPVARIEPTLSAAPAASSSGPVIIPPAPVVVAANDSSPDAASPASHPKSSPETPSP
jgi:hypothetical protein